MQEDFTFLAFNAAEAQRQFINSFSIADGDRVVFGSNGPASFEVFNTYMLDVFKTGNAVFYTWWNGFEQSITLNGVLASAVGASNISFTSPSTARMVFGNNSAPELGDVLFGSTSADVLAGLGGTDLLIGDAGDDLLIGGEGNDRFDGGAGADTFDGGNGADRVDYNTVGGVTLVMNGSGLGGAGFVG